VDFQVDVQLRSGQGVGVEEDEKALLELAAGHAVCDAAGGEDRSESGRAPAAGMALKEHRERRRVAETADLGLSQGPLEPVAGEHSREVEKRARSGGQGGCSRAR